MDLTFENPEKKRVRETPASSYDTGPVSSSRAEVLFSMAATMPEGGGGVNALVHHTHLLRR